MQYRMGDYEEAVVAYIRAAEIGVEIGQSNAAWMLSRGYGAQGPAAATLAMKLHQRAAGQVCMCSMPMTTIAHMVAAGLTFPVPCFTPSCQLGISYSDDQRGCYCTSMLRLGLPSIEET